MLDLNLLRVLVVVVEHSTLTAASEHLHVSQPSISQALQRLQALLQTDLFIKKGRQLVPTRAALDLCRQTSGLIDDLEVAVANLRSFDPAVAQHLYRIALTDVGEQVFLPALVSALRDQAPHAQLEVVPLDTATAPEQLMSGHLDVAISSSPLGSRLRSHAIRNDRYVCITAPDRFGSPGPSLPELNACPRIVVPMSTGHVLMENSLDPAPAGSVTLTNFSTIPPLVLSSDLIAFAPEALVAMWQKSWHIDAWAVADLADHAKVLAHVPATGASQASKWFSQLAITQLQSLE